MRRKKVFEEPIDGISDIQSIAIFLGWNRDAAFIVNQNTEEIAPNGTRRNRRINNTFLPDNNAANSYFYIHQINNWLNNKKSIYND